MSWIKQKVRNWLQKNDDFNVNSFGYNSVAIEDADCSKYPDEMESYTLRVWKANGGRCIQYKRWDTKTDKMHSELYVISDGEDLSDAVKNIVIQEALAGH